MEEKINIVKILADKPKGTKLYSSACGKCKLEEVDDKSFKISFYNSKFGFMNGGEGYLDKNGKLYDDGECIIFPSKEMRDWSKFAWKKGDVLVNSRGLKILFDRWANDNYTSFYAKTINLVEDAFLDTNLHTLASEKEAKSFVKCIEEKLGGKLNLETLEIEKKPEFKDGDILYAEKDESHTDAIFILRIVEGERKDYACLILNRCPTCDYSGFGFIGNETLRYATEEEKRQLFDALAKKGKAWDAEHKMIVGLKPKWTPKPFDRVITRGGNNAIWTANIFSHIDRYGQYVTIGCIGGYPYCIPYNEKTAKLIGTTNNWEG